MSLLQRLLEYWYHRTTDDDQSVRISDWKTLSFSSPSHFGKTVSFYSEDSSNAIYTLRTSLLDNPRITLSHKGKIVAKAHYTLGSDMLIEYVDQSSGLTRQLKFQCGGSKFRPVFDFVYHGRLYNLAIYKSSNQKGYFASKSSQQYRIIEQDSKQVVAIMTSKSGYRQRGMVKMRKQMPEDMGILVLAGTLAFRDMQRRKRWA